MKQTIQELENQLTTELKKLHSNSDWNAYLNCECSGRILYGLHINVNLYYDKGKPTKATNILRVRVTNIIKKYYSQKAKFYKAQHTYDGSCCPSKPMLQLVILV